VVADGPLRPGLARPRRVLGLAPTPRRCSGISSGSRRAGRCGGGADRARRRGRVPCSRFSVIGHYFGSSPRVARSSACSSSPSATGPAARSAHGAPRGGKPGAVHSPTSASSITPARAVGARALGLASPGSLDGASAMERSRGRDGGLRRHHVTRFKIGITCSRPSSPRRRHRVRAVHRLREPDTLAGIGVSCASCSRRAGRHVRAARSHVARADDRLAEVFAVCSVSATSAWPRRSTAVAHHLHHLLPRDLRQRPDLLRRPRATPRRPRRVGWEPWRTSRSIRQEPARPPARWPSRSSTTRHVLAVYQEPSASTADFCLLPRTKVEAAPTSATSRRRTSSG